MGSSQLDSLARVIRRHSLARRCVHIVSDWYFARAEGRRRLFRGVYPDLETARRSAPKNKPVRYDDSGWTYGRRDAQVRSTDYPVMFWLAKLFRRDRSVLDFGGNVGTAFYSYRKYLEYPAGLRWMVYDLPEKLEAGMQAWVEEGSPAQLSFVSDLAECSEVEVFLAAGSLQFVPELLPEILRRLRAPPPHLLLNKLPISEGKTFITLQNTGTAYWPCRVYGRAELVAELAMAGYKVVDSWDNPELSMLLPDEPGHSLDALSGMYLRR